MLVLSTRIVLDCFYLLILYSEKFSTDVCRLPYAVNVNLNLSVIRLVPSRLSYLFLFIRSLLFQLRNSLQSDVSMKNSSIIN